MRDHGVCGEAPGSCGPVTMAGKTEAKKALRPVKPTGAAGMAGPMAAAGPAERGTRAPGRMRPVHAGRGR